MEAKFKKYNKVSVVLFHLVDGAIFFNSLKQKCIYKQLTLSFRFNVLPTYLIYLLC